MENDNTLAKRRPAELTTFIASLVVIAIAVGVDVSTELLLAGFVVVGLLPSIVTFYVDIYKDAFRGRID